MAIEAILTHQELTDIDSAYDESQQQHVLEMERANRLIFLATNVALKSAFEVGVDMPVGAVAAVGNYVIGRGMASDRLIGQPEAHAERMALIDAKANVEDQADTLAVTMEPCPMCQDYIAGMSNIKNVYYMATRQQVEQRGLVRSHSEHIFQRAERVNLPYSLAHVSDPRLGIANEYILDYVERNRQTGAIKYSNDLGLARATQSLNNIFPGEPKLYSPYDEMVAKRLDAFGPVQTRQH